MNQNFTQFAFTPSVKTVQEQFGSRQSYKRMESSGDRFLLTDQEKAFIESRVDFFLSTVGENGWPYMQHRGGPKGFLKVLSNDTLGFADFKGNRQYISIGNTVSSGKALLFLIDYPNKQRVKIWVESTFTPKDKTDKLIEQLVPSGMENQITGVFTFKIQAYDWNCPKYITQRYTAEEFAEFVSPEDLQRIQSMKNLRVPNKSKS